MTKTGKRLVLASIGGVFALSIVAFGLLLWRSNRHGDMNNEDVVLRLAKAAVERDDPPAAAHFYQKLVQLNQFKDEYKDAHYHALVRMRDFSRLAAYTNERPAAVHFTPAEKEVENLLYQGWAHELRGSNEAAVVFFEKATNLNYFAAAPELVDGNLRCLRFAAALDVIRAYTKRFPLPRLVFMGAELCALAGRGDLVSEFTTRYPSHGRPKIVFGLYCDALAAWTKGDLALVGETLKGIGSELKSPLAKLILLESACAGHDADLVQIAWIDLLAAPDFLDFRARGRRAVKTFLGAHFPNKLPIADMGKVADEVLKTDDSDLGLLQISLLAKLAAKTLQPHELDEADRRFPTNRALRVIRAEYQRSLKATAPGPQTKRD